MNISHKMSLVESRAFVISSPLLKSKWPLVEESPMLLEDSSWLGCDGVSEN